MPWTQVSNLKGPAGAVGANGVGVPVGGASGQVLAKVTATNYDTGWITPSSGVTMPLTQPITFSPDNTYDIGASGASRPRNLFVGGTATVGSTLTCNGNASVAGFLDVPTVGGLNGAVGLMSVGTVRWQIPTAGHFLAGADNTYDIGASGASRPRTIYAGTSVVTPLLSAGDGSAAAPSYSFATSPNSGIYWGSGAILTFSNGGVARWGVRNTGQFIPYGDNLFDIGDSPTVNRPRTIYAGTSVITPALVVSAPSAFASGDKYLVVDASGNVHKSAIGPAS